MRIPRVKSFLWFSLKTGSLFVITVGIVTSLITLSKLEKLNYIDLSLSPIFDERDPEAQKKFRSQGSSATHGMVVGMLLHFFLKCEKLISFPNALAKAFGCIMAMYGVEKRKQGFLLPLLLRDAVVLGEFVISVGVIILSCLANDILDFTFKIFIHAAIIFAINSYLSIVLYSYYCQLYEEKRQGINYLVRV